MNNREITKKNNPTSSKGFSLLEMIIYASIMALIMVVVVNTLIVILSTQRDVKNLKAIEQSAISSFDRIIREVRDAGSVELSESQFGVHPGQLTLNTQDSLGNPMTVQFFIDNGVLYFKENNEAPDPLTNSSAEVSNLVFYNVSSGGGRMVKVEMTLEAGQEDNRQIENFYTSAAFRAF